MKNSNFSTEAIVLIILLFVGLFGAKVVLSKKSESPALALPRQESPAMVMAPDQADADYQWQSEQ